MKLQLTKQKNIEIHYFPLSGQEAGVRVLGALRGGAAGPGAPVHLHLPTGTQGEHLTVGAGLCLSEQLTSRPHL